MADRSGELQWHDDLDHRWVIIEDIADGADDADPSAKRSRRHIKRQDLFAPELQDQLTSALHGLRVDYDWHNGRPRNIRPAGAAAPPPPPPRVKAGKFVNPYLFIPARPRPRPSSALPAGLRDAVRPHGHHRIHEHLWSGHIAVTLTVKTPLLLLDTEQSQTDGNGHSTYPVLLRGGAPHLPATSVKGMLRAAYEAVTNSRFGVFTEHTDRLGHRMSTTDARGMVPARISDDGKEVVLLPGDTPVGKQLAHRPLMHAAWLPQYRKGLATPRAPRRLTTSYPNGQPPEHGDRVQADVKLREHQRGFRYWQVVHGTLKRLPDGEPGAPTAAAAPVLGTVKTITGWVYITNQNAGNKHDERIFFTGTQAADPRPLTTPMQKEWANVIRDYRAAHRPAEITERGGPNGGHASPDAYLGHKPGKTAWSPHQYEDSYRTLEPGSLCYAQVDANENILGLYPVTISRSLSTTPPAELLDSTLQPATSLGDLSPADRVFGWVAPRGDGAYRGQLRVGPAECVTRTEDAVEEFGAPGVPLAVLGGPKPQQGRFYLSASQATPETPLPEQEPKKNWYTNGRGLRGRKAYWHHAALPDDHWDNPQEDRTQTRTRHQGLYQEYRRPGSNQEPPGGYTDGQPDPRDNQNRSVLGWVRPGATFRMTLDVDNLDDVELGALIWLLDLPAEHFHRLGHGKPLGFGSVRLDIDHGGCDLRQGDRWIDYYRSLATAGGTGPGSMDGSNESGAEMCSRLTAAFEAATCALPHGPGEELQAFLAAARGVPDTAVHYPRTPGKGQDVQLTPPPDPKGGGYSWFSDNERQEGGRNAPGTGRSLPRWNEPRLSTDNPPPAGGGRAPRRRPR